jgi:hypothetical protein
MARSPFYYATIARSGDVTDTDVSLAVVSLQISELFSVRWLGSSKQATSTKTTENSLSSPSPKRFKNGRR